MAKKPRLQKPLLRRNRLQRKPQGRLRRPRRRLGRSRLPRKAKKKKAPAKTAAGVATAAKKSAKTQRPRKNVTTVAGEKVPKASKKAPAKGKGGKPAASETPKVDAKDASVPEEILDKKAMAALLAKGRQRGYLTYDEINAALPEGMMSADQIDDTLMIFDENEIDIVDEKKVRVQKW